MSGHSKWATIKRKKAATDSARGKVFTRIIKEITMAARQGGGDPVGNPRLRLAISSAKAANMPQENITRGIKKGTGELEGVNYEEIMYEGYAPGGIAMLIESVTDNRNRTVAELRHTINKTNGNMGESGSVSWMFERKGIITIPSQGVKEDDLMEIILEAGADDLKNEEEFFEVVTSLENFEKVRKTLESKNINMESASLQFIAKDLIALDEKSQHAVMSCIEAVEDNDDVQNVYTNADFS